MSRTRVPSDPDLLLAAARLVDLALSQERVAQLVPVMDVTFQLLDALVQGEHGETAPATAFNAAWSA